MAAGRVHPRGFHLPGTCALALLLSLVAPATWGGPLDEWIQVRELVLRGDFDHALELADRLAVASDLFDDLPDQVRAERDLSLGDRGAALSLFRRVTPADGCLVAHLPTYWNSCERMATLYQGVGDRRGQLEMLRRMSFGAGVRQGSSAPEAYLSLAEAYEQIGEAGRAVDYYRTVVHVFDDRRSRRRSEEALDRQGTAEGDPDEVILLDALSTDRLLRRAGRLGLYRLTDTSAAFESLLQTAADPGLRDAALDALVALPVSDLEARLRDRLHAPEAGLQGLAQDALERLSGLVYPFVDAAGDLHGAFDDASPFTGVWGAPFLLERLEDPYESEAARLMALDALGAAGDLRGLEAILQHALSPRSAWRAHALHALRSYGGDRVERIVVGRLEDPDPLVRLLAAIAVSRRDLPEAVDRLAETLVREEDPLTAAALAEAISARGTDEAVAALADLAPRLGPLAAEKAGEGLQRLGDPRGAGLLLAAARREGPQAVWARRALEGAADGLDAVIATPILDAVLRPEPPRLPAEMPGPDAATGEIFAASLRGIPPPPDRAALLLESTRWSEYRGAAVALANTGIRTHLNVIRRRARTVTYGALGEERVQYDPELLEVLGLLQDDAAAPILREALAARAGRSAARAAAARSLGRLGDTEAVPLLLSVFTESTNPDRLRGAAAWSLSRIAGPEIGPVVLGGLESPDPDTRRWTLLLLADTGAALGSSAADRLAEVDPDPDVRQLARLVSEEMPPGRD